MLYFDNAATTKMSDAAINAWIDVSRNNYGNASSIYSYGKRARDILSEAREIIARCIGASSKEIYFTSCGTESDNWAIRQAKSGGFTDVIASKIEHHAVLNAVGQLQSEGYKVSYISVDANGVICLDELEKILGAEKHLVSIMYQNNETGLYQPIQEISQIVHTKNPDSILHTDAVQAIGHSSIDVKELEVDMLSASAHKFNGPKGVGFLYVREGLEMMPLIYGGGQEKALRSGTENVAGIYAMAKALEENILNLDENNNSVKLLEDRLLEKLHAENVKFAINGNANQKAPGVLNVAFDGIDGESLLNALDAQGICVSTGSACNSKSKERSYVLEAMGIDNDRIDSSIRISIGRYNTSEEVDRLASCISKYAKLVAKANC